MSLMNQGLNALDAGPTNSPYHAEWRLLLERLEGLALHNNNASPTSKASLEVDAGFPLDTAQPGGSVDDNIPKRILKETVSFLKTKDSIAPMAPDVELAKYKSLVSQLDKHVRKSMLSTGTSSSSPPTMASDKGSTSSLSVPAYDQDAPSPSPLKFTFTRTSTNSFAVDLFPEDLPLQNSQTPPQSTSTLTRASSLTRHESPSSAARRARSDTVPNLKGAPKGRSRSNSIREQAFGSLQGIAIDENAVHDGSREVVKTQLPFRPVLKAQPPPIGKPSRHRHSRSLPALRQQAVEQQKQQPPPVPKLPAQAADKSVRHRSSANEFVGASHMFFGGFIPPTSHVISSINKKQAKETESPKPKSKRWTIHDRDSWEVIPSSSSSASGPSHQHSLSHSVSRDGSINSGKPTGLDRIRSRFPKSQLAIKTGPLASIANLGSPGRVHPVPVNVNAVIMGPVGSGVSTLIRRFMTGPNEWVPSATIDDFWHHVVRTETRTTYYNITEVTGSEDYVDLRRAILRRAQVVLLCFRLDSREQFRDAIIRLAEDIHTIGEIPIVLVGTFQDSPDREVTSDEAQTSAEALHASYFECSPLLGRGVQELFAHAANVLQAADEVRPTVSPITQPTSASRKVFDLVRGRRSFSSTRSMHFKSSSQSHYVPHSASSQQSTFGDIKPPLPVLNIAPGSDAASANVLLLGPQHFKCVIHGAKSSGRKSLVHRYLHGTFEWLPEAPWMTWKAAVNVVNREEERRPSLPLAGTTVPYALSISETAPHRNLDSLRRSTYNGTNVFVLCFSACDYREEIMMELKDRWFEECRSFNPSIPILVVATKVDQRVGTSRAWTKAQGEALARSIRAAGYLECSAATGEGIQEVFQAIIRIATQAHAQSRF